AENIISRRFPSWLTNRFFSKFLGVEFEDIGCGLQAFRKRMLTGTDKYASIHSHLPIYAVWRGARFTHVTVKYSERRAGETKYHWINLIYYFLDIVLSFTNKPYQMAYLGILGGILLLASIIILPVWFVCQLLGCVGIHGLIIALMLAVLGVVFLMSGLIFESIRRILLRLDKTPLYVVDRIVENPGRNHYESKN
ncbi:hypothetical protein JW979_12345, partial [bacterium]|nr:hypothetical protein [candidate division CSSED10-310 bacterium]